MRHYLYSTVKILPPGWYVMMPCTEWQHKKTPRAPYAARGVSLGGDYLMVTITVRMVLAGLVTVTTALPAARATNPGLVS